MSAKFSHFEGEVDFVTCVILVGYEDFVVYIDAWGVGLGCVLMEGDKVVAYALS